MAILDSGIEELTAGQQIVFAHTANNVVGVLAVACDASTTNIVLSPGGGALFPNAPFYCSIEFEVVWCLSKSGDSLIVQRGQDGTAANSHAVGVSVEMRNNAGLWTDAYNAINSVSTDVGTLATNITNKSALPADVVYTDNVVSLTHKTIDLTDPTKANVIIGTVQPDPASLPLQNILTNGGFEEWTHVSSQTLAAGTPTSGGRNTVFCNAWTLVAFNDSSATAAKDTANPDPASVSGTDLLLNVTTVQGTDWIDVQQAFDSTGSQSGQPFTDISDIKKLVGTLMSVSSRVKLISGNLQCRFKITWYDGALHLITSTPVSLSGSSYTTVKFENQIFVPSQALTAYWVAVSFQGVGQVAVDNVMLNAGATAVGYRPRYAAKPVIVNNILTNPGFEIWQRGNGPFTVNNIRTADGWWIATGGGTMSVSKDTSNPAPNGSVTCMAVTVTTAGTGGNYTELLPIVENSIALIGKPVTFSAMVKTSIANAVRLEIFDGVSRLFSPYHPGDGYYHMLILTANGISDASPRIHFAAACTAYIDNAVLALGGIAADFVPVYPADDFARCTRYYEIMIAELAGYVSAGSQTVGYFQPFKSRKPVAPSLTKQGTWFVNAVGQPAATLRGNSVDGITVYAQSTTNGQFQFYPSDATCWFSAEANP